MTTFSIVVMLFTCLVNCSWTPQVKTMVHEDPQGSVWLETTAQESFESSHPYNVTPSVISRVLRGMHTTPQAGLLQNLFMGREQPIPAFSEDKVEFLTPLLVLAFSKVTPEEQVRFRVPNNARPSQKGSLFVHDDNLFFLLNDSSHATKKSPKQDRPVSASDPSNINKSTVLFFPKEALQSADASSSLLFVQSNSVPLVINLPLLASLPETDGTTSPQPGQTEEKYGGQEKEGDRQRERISVDSSETKEHPSPTSSTNQSSQDTGQEESPEIERLREEMQHLQKELAEQRRELDRLKQEPAKQ